MEKNRDKIIEEVGNVIQQLRMAWKFHPEVWLGLNLTIVQLKILFYIDYVGCTNFKAVSDALGVTPPSITEVIDRLVEQRLVSREENPDNRRMLILRTTAQGKALMARLTESRRSIILSLLKQLDNEDLAHLTRILNNMAKCIEKEQDQPTEESPPA
jgi:DNA-binding MarR family transcriptional regulator